MSKTHKGGKGKLLLIGDGKLEWQIYISDFPSEMSDPKNSMHILIKSVAEFLWNWRRNLIDTLARTK